MLPSSLVYIGLGANLDDPVQKIFDAVFIFKSIGKTRLSSLYLTSPVGYKDQPDFINAVLELHTDLSPEEVLDTCQLIENNMGRVRDKDNQNAPRIIDCDVLVFSDQEIETDRLIVPHPRLAERLFVLQPLYELNAELSIPGMGSVGSLLEKCEQDDQSIIKLN